jgi:DNA end-binding protein Ku
VARFVLREREHLAVIKPAGAVLVLNQMRFPGDIKSPAGLKLPMEKPSAEELKLAEALIRRQTRGFAAEDFHDTFTEKLEQRIQAKLKHVPASKVVATAAAQPPADLIAALKASLAGLEAR